MSKIVRLASEEPSLFLNSIFFKLCYKGISNFVVSTFEKYTEKIPWPRAIKLPQKWNFQKKLSNLIYIVHYKAYVYII